MHGLIKTLLSRNFVEALTCKFVLLGLLRVFSAYLLQSIALPMKIRISSVS